MKKEDIEKYSVTVTGLNESDMGAKEALEAGYITQTGFAESINGTTEGHSTEGHSTEGHSTEGHSETNPTPVIPAPGSEGHSTEGHSTEGHSETSDPVAPGSEGHSTEGHSTEGHSETSDPAPSSTSEVTGDNPTTTTIGGTQFPNDKSVFVANASAASSIIDALTAKDLDSLVSLYKLDQESSWPSATDWKKMNVSTKRSTVKSALGFA